MRNKYLLGLLSMATLLVSCDGGLIGIGSKMEASRAAEEASRAWHFDVDLRAQYRAAEEADEYFTFTTLPNELGKQSTFMICLRDIMLAWRMFDNKVQYLYGSFLYVNDTNLNAGFIVPIFQMTSLTKSSPNAYFFPLTECPRADFENLTVDSKLTIDDINLRMGRGFGQIAKREEENKYFYSIELLTHHHYYSWYESLFQHYILH